MPIRDANGMTTALIGKYGKTTTKARVALLTNKHGSGLASALTRDGHELVECRDWVELGSCAAESPFDLVLCEDEVANEAVGDFGCPVLIIGDRHEDERGHAIPLAAIEASLDTILALAVALAQSASRCRELDRILGGFRNGDALIGRSPQIRRLQGAISRAADCDATVLVEGPVGSGKSLAARMIHCKGRRANKPLVVLQGAATTADVLQKAIEDARGTTLVVEDVDRLPTATQAALVRHLKERPATQAAGTPRLIATTSAHLPELVARGSFREDLFYRLHTMPVVVPSLRERIEDITLLAQAILEVSGTGAARPATLTPAAIAFLEGMAWPGNVAQLETVVRRAQALAAGHAIDREHVAAPTPVAGAEPAPAASKRGDDTDDQRVDEESVLPFEQEEQRMLTRALRATRGNVRRAAQLLGIGRATLYRKIQQYQLRLQ